MGAAAGIMESHPDIGGSCDDSCSGNAAHLHPQAEAMSRIP